MSAKYFCDRCGIETTNETKVAIHQNESSFIGYELMEIARRVGLPIVTFDRFTEGCTFTPRIRTKQGERAYYFQHLCVGCITEFKNILKTFLGVNDAE